MTEPLPAIACTWVGTPGVDRSACDGVAAAQPEDRSGAALETLDAPEMRGVQARAGMDREGARTAFVPEALASGTPTTITAAATVRVTVTTRRQRILSSSQTKRRWQPLPKFSKGVSCEIARHLPSGVTSACAGLSMIDC